MFRRSCSVAYCTGQENRLESFHVRCLRRFLGIKWQNRVTNIALLEKANSPATCAMARSRPQDGRWAQHTPRNHCLVNKLLDVTNPPSSSAFQGCLQARHEIDRHQLKHLGIAHCGPQWLEICAEGESQESSLLYGSESWTREPSEKFPRSLSTTISQNEMAEQGHQYRRRLVRWLGHVHRTQHTQTHHCLLSLLLDVTNPPSSSVFQGCLQARHEIDRNQLKHLVIAHCGPQWLEICAEGGSQESSCLLPLVQSDDDSQEPGCLADFDDEEPQPESGLKPKPEPRPKP
ncbi:hypothetical protein RRG08_063558, partial [Elysia crispata]